MLSRPPISFASRTSASTAARSESLLGEDLAHAVLAHHARQPVAAEQEHVAAARLVRVDVELDVGLGAERPRDDRALRMLLGLLAA